MKVLKNYLHFKKLTASLFLLFCALSCVHRAPEVAKNFAFQEADLETGELIFPLVWTLSYSQKIKSPQSSTPLFLLEAPALLLKEQQSGAEVFVFLSMTKEFKREKNLEIIELHFTPPAKFSLPAGTYELKSLVGFLKLENAPELKRAFPSPKEKNLLISIKKGEISTLPPTSMQTNLKKVESILKDDFL